MKKINIITLMVVILVINMFGNCFAASVHFDAEKARNWLQTSLKPMTNPKTFEEKEYYIHFLSDCSSAAEYGWSDKINNRPYNMKKIIVAGMGFTNDPDAFKLIKHFYDMIYYMNNDNPELAYNVIQDVLNELVQEIRNINF